MTTLHDLCYYESHRWQPLVNQHLITNKLDEYVLPDIIQSVIAYITPHPCSNQIKRFRYDRLRTTYGRGMSSFDIFLRWKAYKYHGGGMDTEEMAFVDALWIHYQHLDVTETLDSCDVCQRGDRYTQFIASTNYRVNSHIRPYIPLLVSIAQGVSRLLSNAYGSGLRRSLLHTLATVDVKQELIKRHLYHPEGVVSMSMLEEIEQRFLMSRKKVLVAKIAHMYKYNR